MRGFPDQSVQECVSLSDAGDLQKELVLIRSVLRDILPFCGLLVEVSTSFRSVTCSFFASSYASISIQEGKMHSSLLLLTHVLTCGSEMHWMSDLPVLAPRLRHLRALVCLQGQHYVKRLVAAPLTLNVHRCLGSLYKAFKCMIPFKTSL